MVVSERIGSRAVMTVISLSKKREDDGIIISKYRGNCRIKNKRYMLATFEKIKLMEAKVWCRVVAQNKVVDGWEQKLKVLKISQRR